MRNSPPLLCTAVAPVVPSTWFQRRRPPLLHARQDRLAVHGQTQTYVVNPSESTLQFSTGGESDVKLTFKPESFQPTGNITLDSSTSGNQNQVRWASSALSTQPDLLQVQASISGLLSQDLGTLNISGLLLNLSAGQPEPVSGNGGFSLAPQNGVTLSGSINSIQGTLGGNAISYSNLPFNFPLEPGVANITGQFLEQGGNRTLQVNATAQLSYRDMLQLSGQSNDVYQRVAGSGYIQMNTTIVATPS